MNRIAPSVPIVNTTPALEELQSHSQWVCWKLEPDKQGKLTKVPYNPRDGRKAKANDKTTWSSHEQAAAILARYPDEYTGLGYEFLKERGITGIDLDHCIDESGIIAPWAQEVVNTLNSYTEYSPSHTGLHLFVGGTIPSCINRRKGYDGQPVEMYDKEHFLTITGLHLPGTPETIESRQEQLLALHTRVTANKQSKQEQTKRRPAPPLSLSDNELLDKALGAKNSAKFSALWNGITTGYNSDSEADEALCFHLAFWTQKNAGQMDNLFRRSRLYREKWDERHGPDTYGNITIGKAIDQVTTIYNPHRALEQQIQHLLEEMERILEGRKNEEASTQTYQIAPKEVTTERILEYLGENEWGDARLFAESFEGQVLYDCSEKAWYLWHGHYWKKDSIGRVRQLVSGYLGAVYLKASASLNIDLVDLETQIRALPLVNQQAESLKERTKAVEGQMKALTERAKALRGAKRNTNVQTFAQTDPRLAVTSEVWDRDPWLLAITNGVIDLKTGECRDGQAKDYIRTVAPTEWNGLYTECPRFTQFLNEIFDDRTENERLQLITFLQRLLGYAITGLTQEHLFPILFGEEGRNGKDTLLALLKSVLGPIAGAISNDVFIATDKWRSPGAATPHLVDLQGKRIVWGSETKQGDKLNISQVKHITGGGEISARANYGNQYTYQPTHTLLLITNYKPHADARDQAFWERAILIEFRTRFVDDPKAPNERKKDSNLIEKLKAEASGILAWLARGCLKWQDQGLSKPESVIMATDKYRQSEDRLQAYIDECCYVWDENATIKASVLYSDYKDWCKNSGFTGMNEKLFSTEMGKKYPKKRGNSGNYYHGIRLHDPSDPPEDPRPSVYRSENSHEPYTANETASEASIAANGVGCVGKNQEVPMNQNFDGSCRELYEKTLHTLHSCDNEHGIKQPVESDESTVYGSNGTANPTLNPTPQITQNVYCEAQGCTKLFDGRSVRTGKWLCASHLDGEVSPEPQELVTVHTVNGNAYKVPGGHTETYRGQDGGVFEPQAKDVHS